MYLSIFPLLSKAFGSRINCYYSLLFQIWNKNKRNIIISRVISSHMSPIYIETPYIYIYIYIYIYVSQRPFWGGLTPQRAIKYIQSPTDKAIKILVNDSSAFAKFMTLTEQLLFFYQPHCCSFYFIIQWLLFAGDDPRGE